MNPIAEGFLQDFLDRLDRTNALGRMSAWLPRHTRLGEKPFSFKDHEFQMAIADETHPDVCVIKSSQIGLTELSIRTMLGFLAVSDNVAAIYTMPTSTAALRNSKSRIDPIIRYSKFLSSMVSSGSDSASFKQIGTSQLYVHGTWGSSIISIPADALFVDELDFSSLDVVKTAESRLAHSRFYDEVLDIRGYRRRFSTPTLPGIAVSAEYDASDRRQYLCKCKSCAKWFWPQFLDHVVVDGWDRPASELTEEDISGLEERGLAASARILCPNCHNVVTKQNLGPGYREWVAERPSVTRKRGYACTPLDLPAYHTPASLLLKRLDYWGEEGHYRNFALGLPFADASNGILDSAVQQSTVLQPVFPDAAGGVYGAVIGCDVGKTSHVVVGVPYRDRLEVIWCETVSIREGMEDGLVTRLVELVRAYRAVKVVIDALPYSQSVLNLQAALPEGMVLANSYNLKDRKLAPFLVDERDWTVNSNRTKVLDAISRRVNAGRVKFPNMAAMKAVAAHLQSLKRVDSLDDQGNWVGEWQRTGPDHYFHALCYLNIAAELVESGYVTGFAMPPGFREAVVGGEYERRHAPIEGVGWGR